MAPPVPNLIRWREWAAATGISSTARPSNSRRSGQAAGRGEHMSAPNETMQHGDSRWQIKLLPFMVRSIVVMGLLFFLSSTTQLYLVYLGLRTAPEVVQPLVQAEE